MSRIAVVLRSERVVEEAGHGVDVVVDPGGGANVTAPHFASPGVDALPLPGDFAALEESSGSGAEQCCGYADVVNASKAAPGEVRIYARGIGGLAVVDIWLKSDGTIAVNNGNGTIAMGTNGDVTINGVVISAAGAVSAPGEVTAKATTTPVKLSTHLHPTPVGPTSAPTPGT